MSQQRHDRWIRTTDGRWYVHELRGVVYVSWVAERDRQHALRFPAQRAHWWVEFFRAATGLEVEAVEALA